MWRMDENGKCHVMSLMTSIQGGRFTGNHGFGGKPQQVPAGSCGR